MPVSNGDIIEISMNIFSEKGLVDLKSIQWIPPSYEPSRNIDFINFTTNLFEIDKTAKIVSDLSRICEIEDSVTQWLTCSYLLERVLSKFNLEILKEYFTCDKLLIATIDCVAIKMQLIASKIGRFKKGILNPKY